MAWDDFRGASQAFDAAVRALHRYEAEDSVGAGWVAPRGEGAMQVRREQWTRLTRAQRARKARREGLGS